MPDYAQWAESWVRGMAAAEPRMRAMRRAQSAVAVANRQRGTCPIKGCKNTSHRGGLCAKHLKQVPHADKVALMVELMVTSSRITTRYHRRWGRELAAKMRSESARPASPRGARL